MINDFPKKKKKTQKFTKIPKKTVKSQMCVDLKKPTLAVVAASSLYVSKLQVQQQKQLHHHLSPHSTPIVPFSILNCMLCWLYANCPSEFSTYEPYGFVSKTIFLKEFAGQKKNTERKKQKERKKNREKNMITNFHFMFLFLDIIFALFRANKIAELIEVFVIFDNKNVLIHFFQFYSFFLLSEFKQADQNMKHFARILNDATDSLHSEIGTKGLYCVCVFF